MAIRLLLFFRFLRIKMSPSLSKEQRQIMREQILALNDRLTTHIIDISGQAFGNAFRLGCVLLSVPIIIILIISAYLNRFSLISIFVYAGAGAMLSAIFATFISTRAKTLAVEDNYQQDLNPDIVKFLSANDLTRQQFDVLADEILEEEAQLRAYLIKPSSEASKLKK